MEGGVVERITATEGGEGAGRWGARVGEFEFCSVLEHYPNISSEGT